MKIWIIYDSKFGNNQRVAEIIQGLLSAHHEVHVSYAKKISPKEVLAASPDAVLFGGPRRIGNISFTLRHWVEKYAKLLVSKKIRLKKIAAWETRGDMKEPAKKEGMEWNIYTKNQKTPEQWRTLIQKVPVDQPPMDLLSLIVAGPEDQMGAAKLVSDSTARITEFIQQFER